MFSIILQESYEEVEDEDVPDDAKILSSYIVYKWRADEEEERKLKACIVPRGNEDNDRASIRKDSANAKLAIIRLLVYLVTFLRFSIKTADIKGAYLQSGPIER